ncbi:hypothetical protein [Novosphingobium sp. 9]|uniref:hypothetical protein n=1 Tax=Novosphingobium sp. 9 TaxID=2025349 RepID=UPI0021B5011F|nr:hypothetical protein [Novosphingobium sp. 9]
MRHTTPFSGVKVPFVSGIELGISITSPSSAAADVAEWLGESIEAIHQLDALIGHEILSKAEARGLTNFVGAATSLMTLTSSLGRGLALCQGVADGLIPLLPDSIPEPTPPMRRAVSLLRRADEWQIKLAAYRAADSTDTSAMSAEEKSLDGELSSAALERLIACPAPDMEAVREKMRIMHATDTVGNNGFFDYIIADVETLTAGKGA